MLSVLDVKGVEQYVDHLLSQANECDVDAYEVALCCQNKTGFSDIFVIGRMWERSTRVGLG
jgi:hypothetical protein